MVRTHNPFLIAFIFLFGIASLTAAMARADNPQKPAPTTMPDGRPTGVGVVDLDRVANSMGWTDDMRKNLEETQAALTTQLKESMAPARQQLEKTRDEIASNNHLSKAQIELLNNARSKAELENLGLTPAQIGDLSSAFAMVYNESNNAQQALAQAVAAQRTRIVAKAREAARPAVRRVARANNIAVVCTTSAEIFYYDPLVDITDKVVDELLRSNDSKLVMPEIPKLDLTAPKPPPARTN